MAEEAGFQPIGPMTLFAVYQNTKSSKRDHVLLYICRTASPIKDFKINGREIIDCRFFAVSALPNDVTPSTQRRINEVMNAATVDSLW